MLEKSIDKIICNAVITFVGIFMPSNSLFSLLSWIFSLSSYLVLNMKITAYYIIFVCQKHTFVSYLMQLQVFYSAICYLMRFPPSHCFLLIVKLWCISVITCYKISIFACFSHRHMQWEFQITHYFYNKKQYLRKYITSVNFRLTHNTLCSVDDPHVA